MIPQAAVDGACEFDERAIPVQTVQDLLNAVGRDEITGKSIQPSAQLELIRAVLAFGRWAAMAYVPHPLRLCVGPASITDSACSCLPRQLGPQLNHPLRVDHGARGPIHVHVHSG